MAKLFVRGMREPLLVTIEQGEKVNKMLEDNTIPEETRINVANGKWIGAKKLINYVTFEAVGHSERQERTFSKEIIEKYRAEVDAFLKGGPMTKNARLEFWAKKGAVRIEKVMSKVPGIGEIWTPIITNIGTYQYIRDLEDYIENLDSKINFGERENERKLEESIEKVMEKMTIK